MRKVSGFTIIELVVVITILGRLLTGGVFPTDIRVSTPAAAALTVGITPNGTVGTCEFFHSAFTAGTTTVNIIAVIN